jgi:hypothetical protein
MDMPMNFILWGVFTSGQAEEGARDPPLTLFVIGPTVVAAGVKIGPVAAPVGTNSFVGGQPFFLRATVSLNETSRNSSPLLPSELLAIYERIM